jgi:hypothetical protein
LFEYFKEISYIDAAIGFDGTSGFGYFKEGVMGNGKFLFAQVWRDHPILG